MPFVRILNCNRFRQSFFPHENVHLDNGAMNKAQPHKGAVPCGQRGSSSTLAPKGAKDNVMIIARYTKGVSTPLRWDRSFHNITELLS